MAQLALYRKYRSQSFEDLIGQDHIVRTLQNGLNSNRLSQVFLFTGPRGTGKTSSARLLAKATNCEKGPTGTPCNVCDHCRMITEGSHPDVIEIDAASESGVDDVREKIIDVVSYAPMMARSRVFIIDEVHDLSAKAFDALLKTIEEPPSHMLFILATTEYSKVPATIRSRCQKFEFHRATLKNLIDRLNFVCQAEGVEAEPQAISAIARMADGGYRDALTLLEQAILVANGRITVDTIYDQLGLVADDAIDRLLFAIQSKNVASVINELETVIRSGRDPRALLESMLYRVAELTRVAYEIREDQADAVRDAALHDVATRMGRSFLIEIRSHLAEAHKVIRDITLPKLWLESELIRIAFLDSRPTPSQPKASQPTTSQPASSPSTVRPVATKPAEPQPAAQTAPPSSPTVQAIEVTKVESETESTIEHPPAPTENQVQQVSPLADQWNRFIQSLPLNPNTGNPAPHAMKLSSANLVEDRGDVWLVSIARQMDLDWFNSDPKRLGFLTQQLATFGRPNCRIELVLEKKNDPGLIESEAVELPLEGEKLDQAVRNVFHLDSNS